MKLCLTIGMILWCWLSAAATNESRDLKLHFFYPAFPAQVVTSGSLDEKAPAKDIRLPRLTVPTVKVREQRFSDLNALPSCSTGRSFRYLPVSLRYPSHPATPISRLILFPNHYFW